jgi:hypothetical protein
LGSWPVAVSVSEVTSDGGRTSTKASALRSSPYWVSARLSVAPGPAQQAEHGAAQLGGPFGVEDAQRGPDVPVGHPLGLAVAVDRWTAAGEHRIVAVGGTVGGVGMGDVGDDQQQGPQLGRLGLGRRVELPLAVAQRTTLRLEPLGLVAPAVAEERTNLL